MPSASALRIQIERTLERRFPSSLTPAPHAVRDTESTGIDQVDELLDGGLPVGAISEITGPLSSGRTSLALSFLANRTNAGQVCAWVDVNDALDPESAAASGVLLQRLLWVRCHNTGRTPGAKPWSPLDQALRATDLLLQSGGFSAVVLDMGDLAPEHGSRVPLATWYRFRQSADQARTCLVVLGKVCYAQSSAAVGLECALLKTDTATGTVLDGFSYTVARKRQQFTSAVSTIRKPPASTWTTTPSWAVSSSLKPSSPVSCSSVPSLSVPSSPTPPVKRSA